VEFLDAQTITGAIFAIGTALFVSYFFLIDRFKNFLLVSLYSTFWICIVFAFLEVIYDDGQRFGPISAGMDLMLFFGLALMGAGWFFYKKPIGHKIVIVGWQLFGLYWLFTIPIHFFNGDLINQMFLGGGIAFFTVLGYHEYLSMKWNEVHRGLKFMTGATFVTGFIYFYLAKDWELIMFFTGNFNYVERFSLGYQLIYVVAFQSSWLANLLYGFDTSVSPGAVLPLEGIGVPIQNTGGVGDIGGISLILACTGIEAMAMFFGAIVSLDYEKDPWKAFKKVKPRMKWYKKIGNTRRAFLAFMVTVPVIWVLNLFRNAFIIYFIRQGTFHGLADQLGMDEFTLLHGVIAKIFAFIVLIILALVIFDMLPELHTTIMDLFGLPKRDAPAPILVARKKREDAKRKAKKEAEAKAKAASAGAGEE
jgi:exosortase/archaeosortase family protein